MVRADGAVAESGWLRLLWAVMLGKVECRIDDDEGGAYIGLALGLGLEAEGEAVRAFVEVNACWGGDSRAAAVVVTEDSVLFPFECFPFRLLAAAGATGGVGKASGAAV